MTSNQLKEAMPARELFLHTIQEFISQVGSFKKSTKDIWTNHRKELLLKPDLEKCVEYATQTEYIPKAIRDYYVKNRYYIETDLYLIQRVFDKYSLGKVLEYKYIDVSDIAKLGYKVESTKGKFLLLETTDNKTTKELLAFIGKLQSFGFSNLNKLIGTKHIYGRYFHIYQFD